MPAMVVLDLHEPASIRIGAGDELGAIAGGQEGADRHTDASIPQDGLHGPPHRLYQARHILPRPMPPALARHNDSLLVCGSMLKLTAIVVKARFNTYISAMPTRFRLAQLLEEKGIGQRELAKRSDVSLVTINRMCLNRTAGVSLEVLEKLSVALGCEPCDLIAHEKPKAGKK